MTRREKLHQEQDHVKAIAKTKAKKDARIGAIMALGDWIDEGTKGEFSFIEEYESELKWQNEKNK